MTVASSMSECDEFVGSMSECGEYVGGLSESGECVCMCVCGVSGVSGD